MKQKGVKAMDNQKDFLCLEHNGKILSKQIEAENDFQETVPAYCDDIYRVIKCSCRSYITSADISYNEIKIYGKIEIGLSYYNENSNICFVDFEENFTKTVSADNLSDSSFVCADICDKYINYRVINQRRIDIHTSSTVIFDVYDRISCPQISVCENAKLKKENVKTSNIINSIMTKIEFDEDYSLPAGFEPVKRVISFTAYASVTETKTIKDKALVKANVNISALYVADNENEEIENIEYTFNVSKIIDCSGISDKDICISDIKIGSLYVKAKNNGGERVNALEIFGDLSLNNVFIRENRLELVTDGYIPEYISECSYSDYGVNEAGEYVNENKLINLSFPMPDGVNRVYDIGLTVLTPIFKSGKLIFSVQADVLCENENGEIISFSAGDDAELNYPSYSEAVAGVSINSFDYTISDRNSLDLRINSVINMYMFNTRNISVLTDVNETDRISNTPSLTVYFGKADESVWNIAKRFSSDENVIIEENSLVSDILDADRVLIIPKA